MSRFREHAQGQRPPAEYDEESDPFSEDLLEIEFTNWDNLFKNDFFKDRKKPYVKNIGGTIRSFLFHRFSLDDNRLVAEYAEGGVWFVLGYIDQGIPFGLPIWKPNWQKHQELGL